MWRWRRRFERTAEFMRQHVQGGRIPSTYQAMRSLPARHMLDQHGGHGAMPENGVGKSFRDAAFFLHKDAMP